jgi:hypothetical protein
MESIVNPWIIYLLWKIDTLRDIIRIPCIVALIIFIVFIFIDAIENDGDCFKENSKNIKKGIFTWLFLVSFVVLLPSKNTIIAMYVANEITYNRAEKAVDITKDLKNTLKKDIIDIIQEVTKEDAKQ